MDVCEIDWLPAPEVVMARSKAAAAADVLLSPDPDLRQYHCCANWKDGIAAAWRHEGAGSHYFILQSGDVTAIKVCVLHTSLGPDALYRFQTKPTVPLPDLAKQIINEPEFRYQELSFLAWTEKGQPWQGLVFRVDNIPSMELGRPFLDLICVGPKAFYLYAQAYHEVTLDPPALKALFQLAPITADLANTLAPEADFEHAKEDLRTVGYPLG